MSHTSSPMYADNSSTVLYMSSDLDQTQVHSERRKYNGSNITIYIHQKLGFSNAKPNVRNHGHYLWFHLLHNIIHHHHHIKSSTSSVPNVLVFDRGRTTCIILWTSCPHTSDYSYDISIQSSESSTITGRPVRLLKYR